jgi:hypothetical protein
MILINLSVSTLRLIKSKNYEQEDFFTGTCILICFS